MCSCATPFYLLSLPHPSFFCVLIQLCFIFFLCLCLLSFFLVLSSSSSTSACLSYSYATPCFIFFLCLYPLRQSCSSFSSFSSLRYCMFVSTQDDLRESHLFRSNYIPPPPATLHPIPHASSYECCGSRHRHFLFFSPFISRPFSFFFYLCYIR